MNKLAIIGGTGLTNFKDLNITQQQVINTPYGETSAPIIQGVLDKNQVIFLARHGSQHNIPPHKINYRANIWALKQMGVTDVIAIAAVGGINSDMLPSELVIPNQLIDYTESREHTFFADNLEAVTHIDFTEPYCEKLRQQLLKTAKELNIKIHSQGIYGATQGPRLETAAEINRLERDGCDIVGMTGMPEAVLARELELCYATCAIIANPAAGRSVGQITMEDIRKILAQGMKQVYQLLTQIIYVT